jgi:hypothetical protein
MTPRLLNDICRCHDDQCPDRAVCLRWLTRDTGYTHVASLRNSDGTCYALAPALDTHAS